MSKLRLRLARLAVALGAFALCWACNAPFIPIPPPGQSTSFTSALVSDGAGGQKTVWTAHGGSFKYGVRARFYVFDRTHMAGVIAEAGDDGSYTSPPFDGTMGDTIDISYETPAGALSDSSCFQLSDASTPAPQLPSCGP